MEYSLNAFELAVPDIDADLYEVDPQPSDNPYRVLGGLERSFEQQLDGKAQKWKQADEDWYIAVIGANERKTIESPNSGTSARYSTSHTLDPSAFWDRMVLQRAISDSVQWYMTTYQDFWYHEDADALFYSSPRGKVDEYDVYTGYSPRVEFHDTPQLVVRSVTKFISSESLADRINHQGIKEAKAKYGGENFRLDRPEPTNCTLHGISTEKTVSDKTLDFGDKTLSVLEFVQQEYGDKWADKIDPDEPLVQIRFGNSDPYDTAPSLLNASPEELNRRLTGEAALSARERQKAIQDFIRRIDFVQIEDEKVSVSGDGVKPAEQGDFDYPDLVFGNDEVLSAGTPNAVDPSQEVHPGNWRWIIQEYLEEYGFWVSQRKLSEIVLVYPGGEKTRAENLYQDVRERLSEIGGVQIRSDPHRVCYTDQVEFDEWVSEFGDSIDGVLGLIEGDGDEYYEIIDAFNGAPTQYVSTSTYSKGRGASDDVIFNTACGLAVKLGAYPFSLADDLNSDVYLGLSVAGDQSTTATAVAIDGRDGRILYQTEEPLGQGNSTVSEGYPAKRIIQQSLKTASSAFDRPIKSFAIHRNGDFGDTELETLSTELPALQEQEYVHSDASWSAVEIIENHPYRLFSKRGSRAPDTGAYAKLDDNHVLVTTYGEPQIHQGTPQPLMCKKRAGSQDQAITDIGDDLFRLSFLNWGSPMMKMKPPVTTKIPKELNEIFDKSTRVRYPPF
jgi:hypothetical protein